MTTALVTSVSSATGWPVRRLGDLLRLAQYGLSTRGERSGDLPMLRMNCQKRGRVVLQDLQYVSATAGDVSKYLLRRGDLLFNRTNSLEHVGRTAIFNGDERVAFASYLVRLRVDETVLTPEFLNVFLNWPPIQQLLKSMATRGVSQANISAGKLKELDIFLPPLSTQRAIGQLLGSLDAVLDAEERRLNALSELWEILLQQFFTHGVKGASNGGASLGTLPPGWEFMRLEDIATLISGGTPPKSDAALWAGDIPWISPKDMKKRILDDSIDHITHLAATTHSRLVPENSILVVIRGMILAKEIPISLTARSVAFNQDMKAILPNAGVNPGFLLYALLAQRPALESAIGTSAHGTRRIGTASLEQLQIPVAPPDEQATIAEILTELDGRIVTTRRKLALLHELFETVRSELLHGARSLKQPSPHQRESEPEQIDL
jgi:type I restriction enzyme S subunit